ncbi:coth-domain-containing protein [Piromyces finnis]|uniref:Coth-domain-containing protein n=1 Tax=Piromyces finnis TaxID=1754191 RepID=A0A1Y1UVT6_9FUNG|nr:coth-domain-containing protein [Piromyces finnis]|eukprot:ORX42186.1 coth-domain-containing protein [Piromyces finnis]
MKLNKILSISFLAFNSVIASRSDFFGDNDIRPELFKILDDHIGTIKISMDEDSFKKMKEGTLYEPNDVKAYDDEKFSTNNASMEFFVNGTDYKVELKPGDFTFKLAGHYTRYYSKPGYNIKLENGSLFDVKTLRLRSMANDVSFMREKLSCDMLYKMGVPTTSANYVNVEINNENVGLYVITDKVKKDMIKRYFNEKNTDNFYECQNIAVRFEDNSIANECVNSKEELANYKDDLQKLVDAVNLAKTIDDIKDIIDVDSFLKVIAFEYILLANDNFLLYGHNFYLYKKQDGKWIMILNDFNRTFAQDIWVNNFEGDDRYIKKHYFPDLQRINLPNISIRDMDLGHKIVKLLIHDDDTRFREILGEIVKEIFNPKILNARIDDIADLIRDDLAISREVQEDGYPIGSFNTPGMNPLWNMTQFEDCINYMGWVDGPNVSRSYALKFFIEERTRYLCHTYAIDPETYELIEPRPAVSFWSVKNKRQLTYYGEYYLGVGKFEYPDLGNEDYMSEEYNADPISNSLPKNYKIPLSVHETGEEYCWSHKYGYPCCSEGTCHIFTSDENGDWGYENGRWCGILPSCSKEECWSKKYGYNCCKRCFIYDVTDEGKWGYENNEWCGIIPNCK